MDICGIFFFIAARLVSCIYKAFTSILKLSSDTGTVGLKKHPELSPTHSAVFQLMKTLLYDAYQFALFCDNLFGNHRLFSLL
jgi:hypothetical protein